MAEPSMLNVFKAPEFDDSFVSVTIWNTGIKPTDKIKIPITFHDLLLDISNTFVYIKGKFKPKDATKPCYLNNSCWFCDNR